MTRFLSDLLGFKLNQVQHGLLNFVPPEVNFMAKKKPGKKKAVQKKPVPKKAVVKKEKLAAKPVKKGLRGADPFIPSDKEVVRKFGRLDELIKDENLTVIDDEPEAVPAEEDAVDVPEKEDEY